MAFRIVILLAVVLACACVSSALSIEIGDVIKQFEQHFPPSLQEMAMQVKYAVTRENLPNPQSSESLEKERPVFLQKLRLGGKSDEEISKYIESFEIAKKKARDGSTFHFDCMLYVSKASGMNVEYRYPLGYIRKYFFDGKNIQILKSDEKSIEVLQNSTHDSWEIMNRFPMVINYLNLTKNDFRLVLENKVPYFEINNKRGSFYQYFFSDNMHINRSAMVSSSGNPMTKCEFAYGSSPSIFPSLIQVDLLDGQGKVFAKETWSKVSETNLPIDYSFLPSIEQGYRIIDRTGSSIPTDEVKQFLNQK